MIEKKHKHNNQHQLRSPIHEREEHKHNSQHQLRSPIHDREDLYINIIVNIS